MGSIEKVYPGEMTVYLLHRVCFEDTVSLIERWKGPVIVKKNKKKDILKETDAWIREMEEMGPRYHSFDELALWKTIKYGIENDGVYGKTCVPLRSSLQRNNHLTPCFK